MKPNGKKPSFMCNPYQSATFQTQTTNRATTNNGDAEFDEMLSQEKQNFEMDEELFELRQRYMEMKKERAKAEKDSQLLENKLKLLQNEETKAWKQFERNKKEKEDYNNIRNQLLDQKDYIDNLKLLSEKEVDLKRIQINEMREKISSVLKTYKNGLMEKNKIIAQKAKEIKAENELMYSIHKQNIDEKNKNICSMIKSQEKYYQEKKKREEIDRKLKLKADLERRIMEEEKKKSLYDDKINRMEFTEVEMLKKIQATKFDEEFDSTKKSSSSNVLSKAFENGYASSSPTKAQLVSPQPTSKPNSSKKVVKK